MHLFLTSSPCLPPEKDSPLPFRLNPANGFLNLLSDCIPAPGPLLMIAASPDRHETNDRMLSEFHQVFRAAHLCSDTAWMLDSRTQSHLKPWLDSASLVVLCGGHVPTQQHFFEIIGLRQAIHHYRGTVIGISAGSMNAADRVYAQPELPGEALDRDYERFLPGLALTCFSIIPHLQEVRGMELDGMRLFEDITFPDSFQKPFLAFPDGSYIYQHGKTMTGFGEMYCISMGSMGRICRAGETLELGGYFHGTC